MPGSKLTGLSEWSQNDFVKFQWVIKDWMSDRYPLVKILDFTLQLLYKNRLDSTVEMLNG